MGVAFVWVSHSFWEMWPLCVSITITHHLQFSGHGFHGIYSSVGVAFKSITI